MLLQNAGLTHVRQKTLDEYKSVVQRAFHEFINQNILQRLALPKADPEEDNLSVPDTDPAHSDGGDLKIVTTETELAVFRWVQQRLAFLVRDDAFYGEIGNIGFRDYQGKFVVYYMKERKGRLFDFIEGKGDGQSPKYRFVFPDDAAEGRRDISTNKLKDIDADLLTLFTKRVNELTGNTSGVAVAV
jgi:hypothetical protein